MFFCKPWAKSQPQALAAALADPSRAPVDVLLEVLPTLAEPYARYCAGIPTAQALYEKKMAEKDFVDFENSFPALNKPTLNHIMRPVQVFLFCFFSKEPCSS